MFSDITAPLREALLHAAGDALLVTVVGVMLVSSLISVIIGVRSGVWHVFLPCLAVGVILLVLATHILLAFPFTWVSAGIGFLLAAVIAQRGWRILASLARILTP